MTDLVRSSGRHPVRRPDGGLSRLERRQHRTSLARIEREADLRLRANELAAEIGDSRVQTVVDVGLSAIAAETLVSGHARRLVEMEPSAIHGVAFLQGKLTVGLGQIVDKTVREVNR